MKTKNQKSFKFREHTKKLYLMTLTALMTVAVIGYLAFAAFNGAQAMSAQGNAIQTGSGYEYKLTPEMLSYALNFKSDDLNARYQIMNQLPCMQLDSAELGGRTLKPGVYCLPAANLDGNLVLDGEGSAASIFVFRVNSKLTTKADSGVTLSNSAQASNVFFVTDSARIGARTSFSGTILSKRAIDAEEGARVKGRFLSLSGTINAPQGAQAPEAVGYIEICKAEAAIVVPESPGGVGGGLDGRIFRFTITNGAGNPDIVVNVPVGSCSGPIAVNAGMRTITETQSQGGFVLDRVNVQTQTSPSTLETVNLPAATATVNVVMSEQSQELVLQFVNRTAITGYIEICKEAATVNGAPDPDVSGMFRYNIDGVYSSNIQDQTPVLQEFVTSVGNCTGAIAVTTPTNGGNPSIGAIHRVTELGRDAGVFLESVTTVPANRQGSLFLNQGIDEFGNTYSNPGGGYVEEGIATGTPGNETLVTFFNRSSPGRVKVCKIAGPGITVGDVFRFEVRGTAPNVVTMLNSSSKLKNNSDIDVNSSSPAGVPDPEVDVIRYVDVLAGPADQGGYCQFVDGTFVVGTNVLVTELGRVDTPTVTNPAGTTGTLANRLNRAGVQGTCGTNTFPGAPFTGNFIYNTHRLTNVSNSPICVNVTLTVNVEGTATSNTQVAAFTAPFTSGDITNAAKYLGDPGSSSGSPPTVSSFSATIPANSSFDLVVFSANDSPQSQGAQYTLNVTPGSGNCSLTGVLGTAPSGNNCIIGETITPFPVSRIRSFSTVAPAGTTVQGITVDPNPNLETKQIIIPVRREINVVEYTNFVFRPTTLKVCKIAGSPALLNQPFTFDINFVSPTGAGGDLFPPATTSVTVTAGSNDNGQGGNCKIVDASNFIGGAFNVGSTITITERSGTVSDISCSTCGAGGFTRNNATRTATLSGANGLRGDVLFNIVTFTNSATTRPSFDFDGDGKSDVSAFRSSNGMWYIDGSQTGFYGTQFGASTDKLVPADYDGDGKTDVAVFRPSTGIWYIQGSTAGFYGTQFGASTDIPMPGDYDGDGKADIAVFRPSTGIWYIQGSSAGFYGMQFGASTDRPVTGDFDGDGKADIAVFRPSSGIWYIQGSTAGFYGIQFGLGTDKLVPADYDGDGKTDVAVYRGEGNWYINGSTSGFRSIQFGNSTDVPVPADYNGDGKADIAVFRDGMWHILDSDNGGGSYRAVSFGMATDNPIPAAFVN